MPGPTHPLAGDDSRMPYRRLAGMKIAMAPVNISGQPITLVNELRRNGVDISLVQYSGNTDGHKFGYASDRILTYSGNNRSQVQIGTIADLLGEGTDLFHFWMRTLFFGGVYSKLTGFDLPFLKAYGRKIVYRFTGEDLRIRSVHERLNPYNAYRYGYATVIDETRQRKYLDFIAEFVDQFVVQDPELNEYWPTARIVPRAIVLTDWAYCGPTNKDRPLVVHAPSSPIVKGTPFVQAAIEALRDEGLAFDYREIVGMSHREASSLYREADIVIDQLHIGWYGVLAIEALALGKTVITYVRDSLAERLGVPIPVLNANPDTIKDVLRQAIKDYGLRSEMGPKARAFVERVHDASVVGKSLAELYGSVLDGEASPRRIADKPYAGLDYLLLQHDLAESTHREAVGEVRRELIKVKGKLVGTERRLVEARTQLETASEAPPAPQRGWTRWLSTLLATAVGPLSKTEREELLRLRREVSGLQHAVRSLGQTKEEMRLLRRLKSPEGGSGARQIQKDIERLMKLARRYDEVLPELADLRQMKKRALSEGDRNELVERRMECIRLRGIAASHEKLKQEVMKLRFQVKKLSETRHG